jgi:NTE family protein
MRSFVGFRTHQLSGDKVFVLSNELRVKLPLRLYLTGRYDIGEVYTATDQIKLRNLRHGVGIFLALDSPIGPLEFGYGIADTDEERFYFNVGYSF